MRMRTCRRAAVVLGLVAAGSTGPLRAAQQAPIADRFTVTDTMIPMRDGVRLHTKILVPRNQSGPLPIIMKRTPYGIEHWQRNFTTYLKDLADDGYIFVFQDIRGRYRSEGTFVMMRPARAPGDTTSIDEGTDTYDTIDWLIHHVPNNNGRVGMLGISYDGWTTIMGALEPHPALKAISPQASPADMWLGDDFHHNGAFRLSYGFEYAARMETTKEQAPFQFNRYDTYDWYLALGPLANVNARYLHGTIPTWNDYVAHPNYDAFWQRQTLIPHITSVKVPTLNVAGWWDQEDFYGPIRIYEALERYDTRHLNYLVVGPWNHGGWSHGTGQQLGNIPFHRSTGTYFRAHVQAPFFAYFLKDEGKGDFPEALTFEAGSDEWRRWNAWPPRSRTTDENLYFHAGHGLSFSAPGAPRLPNPRLRPADRAGDGHPQGWDSYVSDPAHPVPYRHRPIQPTYFAGGSGWYTWLVQDQRFVKDRDDVFYWETPPLDSDVTVAGAITAHLFASTTGSDADWIVKLIDVYPDSFPQDWKLAGYELMVSNEVFRGRYRTSFEHPAPIPPDSVLPYSWSLHTQDYTFKRGHRIMVQVQSTWFPIIDRNPQTYVSNIFQAKASDFRAATQRIYRTARYPSHVTVPVVRGGQRRAGAGRSGG